jgi:hypothetical protein
LLLVLVLAGTARSQLLRATRSLLVGKADRREDIEQWVGERNQNLKVIAALAAEGVSGPAGTRELLAAMRATTSGRQAFRSIELVAASGRIVLQTDAGRGVDPRGQGWFQQALSGRPAGSTVYREGNDLHWIAATPVPNPSGTPQFVVVGDLNVPTLVTLLGSDSTSTGRVYLVDEHRRILADSSMGDPQTGAQMIAAGALQRVDANPATAAALSGRVGSTSYDFRGHTILAGYQPGPRGEHWAVVAEENESEALSLADRNLCRAKETGRNRVVSVDEV